MSSYEAIRYGMQVLGSDGGMIGTVDGIAGEHLKLLRDHAGSGYYHTLPLEWVSRVDEHVHLTLDAATARDRWTVVDAAPAAAPHVAPERSGSWLPWLIGAVLLAAALFFLLRGCNPSEPTTVVDRDADTAVIVDEDGTILNRDVEAYLASSEALPRTFTFNGVQFDTGSAAVREADKAELASLAAILAAHPTARAEIVGYTDSTGDAAANAKLAADRASAVVAELVAGGVAADAITSRSGGEQATAGASQAARRTDLVITAR